MERLRWYAIVQDGANVDSLPNESITSLYRLDALNEYRESFKNALTPDEWFDFYMLVDASKIFASNSLGSGKILRDFRGLAVLMSHNGPARFNASNLMLKSLEGPSESVHQEVCIKQIETTVLLAAEMMFKNPADLMSELNTPLVARISESKKEPAARIWMALFAAYVEHKKLPIGLMQATPYSEDNIDLLIEDLMGDISWDDEYNSDCVAEHRATRMARA